jgi:predicted dehydrogenase
MPPPLEVLIVGYGSAGQRHARNLGKRGAIVFAVDNDPKRFEVADAPKVVQAFANVDIALAARRFGAAVIATPTAFHVDQTVPLLRAGCPVMLEKPVSLDLESAQRLSDVQAETGTPLLLGYTWRWWPALIELRKQLRQGVIGRPLRAELVMASHLEDWHPGEPLSQFFMSNAALGGGALLDESHWLDQMLWMFGEPSEIAADIECVSTLPIDSDDHVELRAFYPGGLRVRVHLDLYTRPTERSIAIYGDKGMMHWRFETACLTILPNVGEAVEVRYTNDRNDMFDALSEEFLSMNGRAEITCSLQDGLSVMRIIEAARESNAARGARVTLRSSSPTIKL